MIRAKFVAMNQERSYFEDGNFERLVLGLFLLLQLWLFSGSFHKFFNNDSLFYMINAPAIWQDFQRFFISPDEGMQYRPLNSGFAGLIKPYLGLDPYPYHWIPLIFHMLNTVLFYCIARRILCGSLPVLFATGFWGFHSVAGWITYDITYLSDFIPAFLFLLSLLLALLAREKSSLLFYLASVLVFALSLFAKEVAVTFPLGIWIGVSLAEIRKSRDIGGLRGLGRALRKTLSFIAVYWVLAFLFAFQILRWLSAGLIYAQGADASYDFGMWSNLLAKAKYLFWALNLPDALAIPHANRNRLLALGLMGCLLALWCLDVLRRKGKLSAVEWGGFLCLVGLNIPALLLSNRLGKWYLYIPLFGLALAFAILAANLGKRLPGSGRRIPGFALLVVLLAPVVFSSHVQTRSYIESSDCSFQSDAVQSYLDEFRAAFPVVPAGAVVYLLPSYDESAAKTLAAPPNDNGRLLNLFYPGKRIQMLFAHKGERLPEDWRDRSDILILQWLNERFCNVTRYEREKVKRSGRYLVPLIDPGSVHVNRNEYYQDYEHFRTPNGLPAFFITPDKDIVTQIAGSTIVLPLGAIPPGAWLNFEVSWMFAQGDGAWAAVDLRTSGREINLYREYMRPNRKKQCLQWKKASLDLRPYAQPGAELLLKCYNDQGKNTAADWLNWRDITITESIR